MIKVYTKTNLSFWFRWLQLWLHFHNGLRWPLPGQSRRCNRRHGPVPVSRLNISKNKKSLIFIFTNLRLGPFGFLAEESSTKKDHPGNLGLYDALLALRWVHENIAHFGGNPHDVTIFGESAGSFAVGSLLLSPLSKGLFHRAIMQSGAPNSYFGVQTYKENGEVGKWLGGRVHCNNETAAQLVDCLKGKTVQELVDGYQWLTTQNQNFKPVYPESLLPIRPVEALKGGKFNHDVDLMVCWKNF